MARSNRPASRITRPEDRFPPVDPGARKAISKKADHARLIDTDFTLFGGGDLSGDRELGIDLAAEEARIIALIQSKIVGGLGCTVTIVGDTIEISVP